MSCFPKRKFWQNKTCRIFIFYLTTYNLLNGQFNSSHDTVYKNKILKDKELIFFQVSKYLVIMAGLRHPDTTYGCLYTKQTEEVTT